MGLVIVFSFKELLLGDSDIITQEIVHNEVDDVV